MTIDTLICLTQQDRARLRRRISEFSGWDESIQTDNALEQAVLQRLAARRLSRLADYWPLIRSGSGDDCANTEISNLVQLLANQETCLFREMHQFEVLRNCVLPELLAAGDRPLRLWSAGCATGEEPYSLAITLLEYQARHGRFQVQVLGTDIDAKALEKARQGRYGERSLRLVSDDLRQRYFSRDGRGYRVVPELARLVSFGVHNLAQDRCPSDLRDVDVIFCRNVTIYFDQRSRDRLNARLAGSLREGGYLFVASAETMSHNQGRLELVSLGDTFLFRKGRGALAPQTAAPPAGPASDHRPAGDHPSRPQGKPWIDPDAAPPPLPQHAAPIVPSPTAERDPGSPAASSSAMPSLQQAIRAFQRQDYYAAMRELDRLPADEPLSAQAHALRGAILLQQERLEEAETACQRLLARDPWHADAHFLLGMVHRHQGHAEDAIQALRQAIYLQPSHRHAHFYLAETYRLAGMDAHARREYENTLNALRAVRVPRQSPDINLSGLEDDILRQACEANLRKLRGRP